MEDPRIATVMEAIATEIFERPARACPTSRVQGPGTWVNLIDANGRHRLAEAILKALDEDGA